SAAASSAKSSSAFMPAAAQASCSDFLPPQQKSSPARSNTRAAPGTEVASSPRLRWASRGWDIGKTSIFSLTRPRVPSYDFCHGSLELDLGLAPQAVHVHQLDRTGTNAYQAIRLKTAEDARDHLAHRPQMESDLLLGAAQCRHAGLARCRLVEQRRRQPLPQSAKSHRFEQRHQPAQP